LAHRRYGNKGLGHENIILQNNNTMHLNIRHFHFNKTAPQCAAGQHFHLKSASGRIVLLTSYMSSLVLLAGYSASLISSLAVQPRHLPFRDLQGLLYDGSYRLGVLQNSFALNIFDVRLRKLTTFTVNIVPKSAAYSDTGTDISLTLWESHTINICVCMYVGMYVYVCVYACMFVSTYICM
jgi:hypothetical protein